MTGWSVVIARRTPARAMSTNWEMLRSRSSTLDREVSMGPKITGMSFSARMSRSLPPDSLMLARAGTDAVEVLKQRPRYFDSAGMTAEQQALLLATTKTLVFAAEQIYDAGGGKEKLMYVKGKLMEKGFSVDVDVIEAMVKEMNIEAPYEMPELRPPEE